MPITKTAFVLVHGGRHNRSACDNLMPALEARSHLVLTLDLPGAGANTVAPALAAPPFDLAAFAAEVSPIAGVMLDERIAAVIGMVKDGAAASCGKLVLVGHSAGRMVVSAVAERIPELLAAIIYIARLMVANGVSLLDVGVGGSTVTHTKDTSHSPFLSQPDALAEILADIASQSAST